VSTISIQINFYTFIARPHGTGIVKPSWRWKTGVWCTPRNTSFFLSTSSYLYFFSLSMCLLSIFYPLPSSLFLNFELLAPYASLSYRPLFKSLSLIFFTFVIIFLFRFLSASSIYSYFFPVTHFISLSLSPSRVWTLDTNIFSQHVSYFCADIQNENILSYALWTLKMIKFLFVKCKYCAKK
jgi:hypothetical protein